ncbi:ACP S-malonyltransferase [Priestia megaterium]|uniref:ACP S-malonyltransferase n=1 Tax=Priestia megaterium TaxID=1404 RepID=UPI003000AD97
MKKPIVFMFSGQGSQYFQMGKELFDDHPVFQKWMVKLDQVVKGMIGESVLRQVYDVKKQTDGKFDRTLYTHPAIAMIEYALSQTLIESGITPDYVLGASMGEFVAAAVADVISVEEMLEMLIKQAMLFEEHCQKGGMLAIFQNPSLYSDDPQLYQKSELASVNFNSHFVVSGTFNHLKYIEDYLRNKGISSHLLPVSYAFHSPLIEPAKSYYKEYLKTNSYRTPTIPFISCVYGKHLTKLSEEYFWNIVRKPVQFSKAIQELDSKRPCIFLDVGPAGTLANFAKRNINKGGGSEIYTILTPYHQGIKNLQRVEELFSNHSPIENDWGKKKMVTYVFAGQGSQYKGMGAGLFEEFEELTAKADKILGYSIKELCIKDPNSQLGKTQFTQPALYVVNALSYLKKIQETGATPDYVAGHSLGEYSALFAAGAFDFETGLKLVKRRGELMGQATGGGMAAIIGFNIEQVRSILTRSELLDIDIANHNAPNQIVISGTKDDIISAQSFFEDAGVKAYIPLNVSGAFHSRYMVNAEKSFADYLRQFTLSPLSIPVISNVNAQPYKQKDLETNLIKQISNSVRWTDSIRYLMALGEMQFEEIGPGRVLINLVNAIRRETAPLVITGIKEKNKGVIKQENEEISISLITSKSLGDEQFKKDYNLKYAYVIGAMHMGISSEEMLIRLGKSGMLGFFGTGGLPLQQIEESIQIIQKALNNGEPYGMNLLHSLENSILEEKTIDLYLKYRVRIIEASGYISMNAALVRYRAKGLKRNTDGTLSILNKVIAKVSRPEVAEMFLSPAPDHIVEKLLKENKILPEEASLLREIPMADDLTVESDSGGHTDQGVAYTLMPSIIKLRNEMMRKYGYVRNVRVGAAGGIGTPEAALAAFMLGSDYIVTGSINQCTIEGGTSDVVKDLLQQAKVQDMRYAPAKEMFEIGAKVQVLEKGLFFPARANKLYDLYRTYESIEEIDEKSKKLLEEIYFKQSFEEVYESLKATYPCKVIEMAERNSKYKMALIFKWYFDYSTQLALIGNQENKIDYQIHCGPALGSFNQWVKGTHLENWANRHVDEIGVKLMKETAELLNQRFRSFLS